MATPGILADIQPFVNSARPSHLKALVANRINSGAHAYSAFLQKLDSVVTNLESFGVFNSERTLNFALRHVKSNQGEISNKALVKLFLEQHKLQQIFAKIAKDPSFANLEAAEISYLLQHPAKDVRNFVAKYQQALEEALETRFSQEIDQYLVKSFTEGC